MLICTPVKRKSEENLGNLGTVVRHNISRNDRTRIFHLSGAEHTLVHDNAIYVRANLDVQMLDVTDWDGWADDAVFRNNRSYVEGVARYGHQVKRNSDGTYGIAPGWGPAQRIVFEGNRYIGTHVDRPTDGGAIEEKSGNLHELAWSSPEFDPANPDRFDAFLASHRGWMVHLFEQEFGRPLKLGR